MIKALLIFVLFVPAVFADPSDLAKERANAAARGIHLTSAEENQLIARGWRDRREGEGFPFVRAHSKPSDYNNGWHRGTVEHIDGVRNYSLHTVRIPNGTVIDGHSGDKRGCNFAQIAPNTEAFDRTGGFGHNLTFRHCNLVNVKTYSDWTIEDCNTAQNDYTEEIDEESGKYLKPHTAASKSKDVKANRTKPEGAIQ
jgi:hypothetical protein